MRSLGILHSMFLGSRRTLPGHCKIDLLGTSGSHLLLRKQLWVAKPVHFKNNNRGFVTSHIQIATRTRYVMSSGTTKKIVPNGESGPWLLQNQIGTHENQNLGLIELPVIKNLRGEYWPFPILEVSSLTIVLAVRTHLHRTPHPWHYTFNVGCIWFCCTLL